MKTINLFKQLLPSLWGRVRVGLLLLCLMAMGAAEVKAAEAYACLTYPVIGNPTLTFYYDNLRSTRTMTYDLGEFNYDNLPGWKNAGITKVTFDASFANARPTRTTYWFYGCSNLTSVTGIENLNTSNVTHMGLMFYGCSKLTSLDVSNFNTENVTGMASMFYGCSQLTSLDVSNFNTENVTSMAYMFDGCSQLTSLDVSNFNTAKVTNMVFMFFDCSALTTIYCSASWSVASSSTSMFSGCTSLVSQTSGLSYDENKTDATYANPITGYFTDVSYAVFTGSNNTLTFYCDNQRNSRPGTSYNLNHGETVPDWISDGNSSLIQHAVFDSSFDHARPVYTTAWFAGLTTLQDITGLEHLHTDEVIYMRSMFQGASGLTSLDLSTFNTGKVTNMANMFYGCTGLTSLDISSFNTENVTTMSYMFRNCSSLTSLDLSSFNTKKVASMDFMFSGCSALTTIIAGDDWSTSAVVLSGSMFMSCPNLTGRNGTKFDSSHTDAEYARFDNAPTSPGYLSDINSFYTGDVSLQLEILGVGALRLIDKDGNVVKSLSNDEPITLGTTVHWPKGTRMFMEVTAPAGYDPTHSTAYLFIDGVSRVMSEETDEDGNIYFTYYKSSITEPHSYTLVFVGLESAAATNLIDWNLLMVGDVDVTNNEDPKDYAELWFNQRDLILMAKEGSSLKATYTIDKTSYIPAETPASFHVYVKPGQTFNVTFNGTDVPFTRDEENDENGALCYKYEATDYEQFATSGTWVVEFKKAGITWTAIAVGDVPEGARAEFIMDEDSDTPMDIEIDHASSHGSGTYFNDELTPDIQLYVNVPTGYLFNVWFNGEEFNNYWLVETTNEGIQRWSYYTDDVEVLTPLATSGTWTVEFKKANDGNYTWNLKVIGDIPEGAYADLYLDGQTYEVYARPSDSYLTDIIEPWPDGNYAFGGQIIVPKGYTFTLLCNGEDISTDFDYNEAQSYYYKYLTAAQSARFNTDIDWVIAFTKIDENDVNCDGEVNISDVTKLVNEILEQAPTQP